MFAVRGEDPRTVFVLYEDVVGYQFSRGREIRERVAPETAGESPALLSA